MRRPIAEGILTDLDDPRLIVGRDRANGQFLFPVTGHEDRDLEILHIGGSGTIWSYTVQRFRPKSPPYVGPEAFEPFAVGYVEFPCGAIVEGRFANVDVDALAIGQPMTVGTASIGVDDAGIELISYAFQPVGIQ